MDPAATVTPSAASPDRLAFHQPSRAANKSDQALSHAAIIRQAAAVAYPVRPDKERPIVPR